MSVVGGSLAPMRQVRALIAHKVPDRTPLQVAIGEEVQVGGHDSEWPEFVFVTSAHGAGWVPARHLSRSAGPAVVQTEYDTAELPTQVGEVLEVVAEDVTSGWLWCRSGTGHQGWIPIKTVEPTN